MLLMIDNYDSFTYNVVQYLSELKAEVKVLRNDEVSVDEVEALAPKKIVVSPGPCTPDQAGISVPLIKRFAGKVHFSYVWSCQTTFILVRSNPRHQGISHDATAHMSIDHETQAAEHFLFQDAVVRLKNFSQALCQTFVVCHNSGIPN